CATGLEVEAGDDAALQRRWGVGQEDGRLQAEDRRALTRREEVVYREYSTDEQQSQRPVLQAWCRLSSCRTHQGLLQGEAVFVERPAADHGADARASERVEMFERADAA